MSSETGVAARLGTLIVLSAPSGTGKTTLVQRLRALFPDLAVSISTTTRQPRRGEQDGVHYHFVSEPEFRRLVDAGDFLEHALVHGHHYGTRRQPVEQELARGRDVLLEIDVEGARQVRRSHPEARLIFILPPSKAELAARLARRGLDAQDVVDRRLANAAKEIAAAGEYDHVVINVDLHEALEQLACIVRSHGLRTAAQAGPIAAIQATFGLRGETSGRRGGDPS